MFLHYLWYIVFYVIVFFVKKKKLWYIVLIMLHNVFVTVYVALLHSILCYTVLYVTSLHYYDHDTLFLLHFTLRYVVFYVTLCSLYYIMFFVTFFMLYCVRLSCIRLHFGLGGSVVTVN